MVDSLTSEHKISLLIQCVESIIDVDFPDIFVISDALILSCFWIAMML
jgi:hypothetical protein